LCALLSIVDRVEKVDRDPFIIVGTGKLAATYEKFGCFYLGQKMIDDEKLKEL